MRITLVQPPISLSEARKLTPPLGLLTLAAVMERDGHAVAVVDLNLEGYCDRTLLGPRHFHGRALALIRGTRPDVVGFTSMAMESHLCLELARLLKLAAPGLVTVFGGPHFASIAIPLLQRFGFVDYVAVGEAERSIGPLLAHIAGAVPTDALDGVAHRRADGSVHAPGAGPRIALDAAPFPAYHLVDLPRYYAVNPRRLLCYEHARGCQLRCAFCYSEAHWGHGETARDVDAVVADMRRLEALGAREIFFVGDNALNDPRRSLILCQALARARLSLRWDCYATLAQLTPQLTAALAAAGCRRVFIGVDAVSPGSRVEFRKGYFKGWDRLGRTLQDCLHKQIAPTCALMLSPFDDAAGTEQTLRTALRVMNAGCSALLNALTLYDGTQCATRHTHPAPAYSESKPRLLYDMPPLIARNELARTHPDLFPFHRTTIAAKDYEHSVLFCHLAALALNNFPATFTRAMVDHDLSFHELIGALTDDLIGQVAGSTFREVRLQKALLSSLTRQLAVRPDLVAVLRYETARLRIADREPGRDVVAHVDGKRHRCRLRGFKVLPLPAEPDRLRRESPLGGARPVAYLVWRDGARVVTHRIAGELKSVLDGLVRAPDQATLAMSGEVFARLEAMRLLESSRAAAAH